MTKPLAQTVGRRKASVVRVRLREGSGRVVLNGRQLEDYFPTMATRVRVMEPLQLTSTQGRFDVDARLEGGGINGQADALRLGIARALVEYDAEMRSTLKKAGLLTRDARAVESKKYGLRKARRAVQYTKR
ncbi:MAG TPA: 30S ribosomal protein S9 [Acidimicrobiia bacterium]|nr:30S ribosomal protein S9 [Acidimicrobiia bacterium]